MSDAPYTPPENPVPSPTAAESAAGGYSSPSGQGYPPSSNQYPPSGNQYPPSGYVPPQGQYPPAAPGYLPPQGQYPPPGYIPGAPYPPPAVGGLSDTAAGALAYVTIIPAIVFLVVAPYNTKPFVRFHAFQCLGLAIAGICLRIIAIIPFVGTVIYLLGVLVLFVCWVLCIVKASQGSAFKLPVIGDFAAQQSGYRV